MQGSACVPVAVGPLHYTESLRFNTCIPLPAMQVHSWESQVRPTLTQAWEAPRTQNPPMSSATWVRQVPLNNMQNSFDPMSIFGPCDSDKADHDDYFGSSNSTCSSIHGDDFGVLDCTDASNILDPKEDEPLLSPDDKAYGYGHDGFPYGYSDAINIGTDSFYGLAPGSSEELGMWKCGQTHFRQDPYQGHASVGVSVGDTSEGVSGGGGNDRKRHTCC